MKYGEKCLRHNADVCSICKSTKSPSPEPMSLHLPNCGCGCKKPSPVGDVAKHIAICGRGLLLAWATWDKNTAEHQKARDKAVDDFVADILKIIRAYEKRKIEALPWISGNGKIWVAIEDLLSALGINQAEGGSDAK